MNKVLKCLGVIFGAIALDQITKSILLYMIIGNVPLYGSAWSVVGYPYLMARLTNWFNIVFTWNPGASFSMFRAFGEMAPVIIIFGTAVIIGMIFYYLFRRATKIEWLPLALIGGGAMGNLIDRIRFGAVIDFIDWHIGDWHWPAFNMADVCIVIGVGLYIINWLFTKNKDK